ncbi:conserved hypothetical protein [Uncinocarpus reesii 1704]|uniref:DUF614 domain-containing protein n=1 Tax=Uncinocarpus reesii (strain UAMH 1704) TaxID=336963 RepID=C4JUX9_UNCRE|nr:uncharacterized protein UREG_04932 [Uncinocarpus reesii 1704]EEP80090.1 conserved hypothetical protein [Uncinocarpus reesii 1704]
MSNPQLHLQPVNSNAARHKRYSYLPTPSEYQAPTFPPRNNEKPEEATKASALDDSVSSPGPRSPPPFSYNVNNAPTQTPSPYRQPHIASPPPPLSEHPAQYAPYADRPAFPQQQTQPIRYQSPPPAPPGSLPPKQFPDVRSHRPKEYTVAPDSNPLQPPPSLSAPKPSSLSGGQSQLGTRITSHELNHAPGQVVHPRQEIKGGTWSYGLCDCRDPGVCCTGLLCPCILYGRTQYRLSRKSEQKDPTNLLGYETCNAPCTAMALLCGCQWLLATIQHIRVRRAYGISSDVATDCVRASCCTCCTLIQDEREIKYRAEAARIAGGVPGYTPPAYATPGQMTFSPPPR